MGSHEVRLLARRTVAPGIVEITFSRPDGFKFAAGQYVQVGVPRLFQPDPRGRSRVFSLVSAVDSDTLSVAFRQTGSGLKVTLDEMPTGSALRLEGPHGHATLRPGLRRPLVLIAGGVGITAFLSMLRLAHDGGHAHPIDVVTVNPSPEVAPYRSTVRELAAAKHVRSIEVTRTTLPDTLKTLAHRHDDRSLWFTSGPPDMTTSTQHLARALGIEEHRLHGDAYIGYD